MTAIIDALKEARASLKHKDWGNCRSILRQLFPDINNSKYVGALHHAGIAAQREGNIPLAEQLYWLAIEIYDSGRDENSDVVVCVKQLYDMYSKTRQPDNLRDLQNQTFALILYSAEGLHRSLKSLHRQLNEKEK